MMHTLWLGSTLPPLKEDMGASKTMVLRATSFNDYDTMLHSQFSMLRAIYGAVLPSILLFRDFPNLQYHTAKAATSIIAHHTKLLFT